MSVILDLFNGDLDVAGRSLRNIPGRKEAAELFQARCDEFCHAISDERQAQLDAVLDAQRNFLNIEMENAFQEGFRLGARLMLEICAQKG